MSDSNKDSIKTESELQHLVTQKTRFKILEYILAHPENLPSLKELDWAISKSKSTIHGHIKDLQKAGIVDKYKLEKGDRKRDLPSTFFGLTEYGISVVDDLGLFNDLQSIRELYEYADQPEEIKRYEDASRPERKSKTELQEELNATIQDFETASEKEENQLARQIKGLSTTLDQYDNTEISTEDCAVILGTRLLDGFSRNESARRAVIQGFQKIADGYPAAVIPAMPALLDHLMVEEAEPRPAVLDILETLADTDPDLITDDIHNRLIDLYKNNSLEELDFDQKEPVLESLEAIFENLDDQKARADVLFYLGSQHEETVENFEEARRYLNTACDLYRSIDASVELADTLAALGYVLYEQSHYEQAIESFSEATEFYETHGKTEGLANALKNLGILYLKKDDSETAIEFFERVSEILSQVKVSELETSFEVSFAKALLMQNELSAAREHAEVAIDRGKEHNQQSILAQAYKITAKIAVEQASFAQADGALEEALEIYRSLDEEEQIAEIKQLRGDLARKQDELNTALEHYQASLIGFERTDNREKIAELHRAIAKIRIPQGAREEPLNHLEQSIELYDQLDLTAELIESRLLKADVYAAQDDLANLEKTIDGLQSSLDQDDFDDSKLQAELFERVAGLFYQLENYSVAIDRYRDACSLYREQGDLASAAMTLIMAANVEQGEGNYSDAHDLIDEALDIVSEGPTLVRAQAFTQLSKINVASGDVEDSIDCAEKALELARNDTSGQLSEAEALEMLGKTARLQDRYDEARAKFTEALGIYRNLEMAPFATNVLNSLVKTCEEAGQQERALQWCQSAQSYINNLDVEVPTSTRLQFKKLRAQLLPADKGTSDLLAVGLTYLKQDNLESAFGPLHEAWENLDALDGSPETREAALSAGVAFAATTRFVDLDIVENAGSEVIDELADYRNDLREPATLLYDYLEQGDVKQDALEREKTRRKSNNYSELEGLEAEVFHDLLVDLVANNNEPRDDPSDRPLNRETALTNTTPVRTATGV
jgi:tetratricopeptide (TPR) repeat protein